MAGNFDRFALGGEQHDDGMAKSLRYSANGSGSATLPYYCAISSICSRTCSLATILASRTNARRFLVVVTAGFLHYSSIGGSLGAKSHR